MSPVDFVASLYLGDRWCKALIIDNVDRLIKIQVNSISRIRDPSGQWKFYTAEDIPDGYVVLENVRSLSFDPPDVFPNDQINYLKAAERQEPGLDEYRLFDFTLSCDHVAHNGLNRECVMHVVAEGVHIEDPRCPGKRIAE